MHVLPICPRPYSQEAARSWLTRVGRVYALNPERLVGILGLVPFEPGSRRYLAQPVEAALDGSNLDQLALATQLPPARLVEMRPDPVEWTLTHTDVCAVCGLCLDEDLCHGRDPYLRAEWRPSWRIFCSLHEVRLLTCRMNVIKGTASDTSVIEQIDDLYAHCGFVEDSINCSLGSNSDFFHMTLAIEEMESVIGE
jgi:TniQ